MTRREATALLKAQLGCKPTKDMVDECMYRAELRAMSTAQVLATLDKYRAINPAHPIVYLAMAELNRDR